MNLQLSGPTTDSVSKVLHAVLARNEYRVAARPQDPVSKWLREAITPVLKWIGRAIGTVLRSLGPLVDRHGRAAAWALGIVAVLILAWVAFRLFRSLRVGGAEPQPATLQQGPQVTPWRTRADRARAALAAGNLRRAATELFAAVVSRLNDRGELFFAPSKTGGDYQRELTGDLGTSFSQVTSAYQEIVFGGEESPRNRLEMVNSARQLGVDVDE